MKTLLVLLVLTSAAHAADITVTHHAADVAGCTFIAQVNSTYGHWSFAGGTKQMKERASLLGADTLLVTSSMARDWLSSGVAYRCAK